jgi:hypothetical protein
VARFTLLVVVAHLLQRLMLKEVYRLHRVAVVAVFQVG